MRVPHLGFCYLRRLTATPGHSAGFRRSRAGTAGRGSHPQSPSSGAIGRTSKTQAAETAEAAAAGTRPDGPNMLHRLRVSRRGIEGSRPRSSLRCLDLCPAVRTPSAPSRLGSSQGQRRTGSTRRGQGVRGGARVRLPRAANNPIVERRPAPYTLPSVRQGQRGTPWRYLFRLHLQATRLGTWLAVTLRFVSAARSDADELAAFAIHQDAINPRHRRVRPRRRL